MKIYISELKGKALDYAVGIAQGWVTYPTDSVEQGRYFHTTPAIAPRGHEHNRVHIAQYSPSTDADKAWKLISEKDISILWRPDRKVFWACCDGQNPIDDEVIGCDGTTHLEAAMRCVVLASIDDDAEPVVEIPEWLL